MPTSAAKLGDNEAALGALERMLLFNPNLPRVQLELGALYFRLGSFDAAQGYFEKALAANPPPDVKARVETYLAQIAQRNSPEHFGGLLFFGAQYQSDANVAPGSSLINTLLLGPVTLQSQFVKHADENIFGAATLFYSHDFGTQSGDAFEVTSTNFVNHYFRFDRLDLGLAEVTAGPRFVFPAPIEGIKTSSVKPYVILNEVGLGEKQYFYTYGGGLEGTALVWDDITVKANFEIREKRFSNAPDRPLVDRLRRRRQIGHASVCKADFADPEHAVADRAGVRFRRSVDPALLLLEQDLRDLRQLSRALPGSDRTLALPVGDDALWRSPVEQLRLPGPVLQHQPRSRQPRLERPLRPALALRRQPDLSGHARYRGRPAVSARYRFVKPAGLRLHQQLGAGRAADPVLGADCYPGADVDRNRLVRRRVVSVLPLSLRRSIPLAIMLLVAATANAQQRVGVNAAVNADATGTPPNGAARRLVIGENVVFNERIQTTTAGQTQVLFLDQSTMTVGPNSDVTIDQFVFNPAAGTGTMALTASKGVLRLIGGALTKQEAPLSVRTTIATIALRGGVMVADVHEGNSLDVVFLFGKELRVTGTNGVSQTITQPGFAISVPGAGASPSHAVPGASRRFGRDALPPRWPHRAAMAARPACRPTRRSPAAALVTRSPAIWP